MATCLRTVCLVVATSAATIGVAGAAVADVLPPPIAPSLGAIRLHAATGADNDLSTGGAFTSLISRDLLAQSGLDGRTAWSMLVRLRFTSIVSGRGDWWRFPDDRQFAMDLDRTPVGEFDLLFETKSTALPINGYDITAVHEVVEGHWYTLVANTNFDAWANGQTPSGAFEIREPGRLTPMVFEDTVQASGEAVSEALLFGNIRPNANTFDLDIAEIAIFDRCLTQAEVDDLNRRTADQSIAAPALLAHWIFNAEGAADTPANGDVNLSERLGEANGFTDLVLGQTPNVGLHTYREDGPKLLPFFQPCPADLNEDGAVDGADLGLLLGSWGSATFDLNADGVTDGADLGLLLGVWGGCS